MSQQMMCDLATDCPVYMVWEWESLPHSLVKTHDTGAPI